MELLWKFRNGKQSIDLMIQRLLIHTLLACVHFAKLDKAAMDKLVTRVHHAPNEQYCVSLDVANQEDKGAVNVDLDWRTGYRRERHYHCRGCCRLSTSFINGDKSLMQDVIDKEIPAARHA